MEQNWNGTSNNGTLLDSNEIDDLVGVIYSVVLVVTLVIVMFSMGCSSDTQKLWFHMKKPWALCTGFLCQAGLMPLSCFLFALAFKMKASHAIAVIMMGSCPGGITSNLATYWMDGDIDLSMCMTTVSTLLSFGTLPLCFFIYTSKWTAAGSISIPFEKIGLTMVSVFVPTSFGLLLNVKWPATARCIAKVGVSLGSFLLIACMVVSIILYKDMWDMDASLLFTGIITPCVGYGFGFLLARMACQSWKRCRTISLETGVQNATMCSTILQVSFPKMMVGEMVFYPMVYSCSFTFFAIVLIAAYRIYRGYRKKTDADLMRTEVVFTALTRESTDGMNTDDFPSSSTEKKMGENDV
nr:PREDICTED: ileal sodium/bile acid cotransporter-like [Lepisosteus oculatus]